MSARDYAHPLLVIRAPDRLNTHTILGTAGNSLVESLTLDLSDLKLELGGLARTVARGEGASAPGRATVDLIEVGEEGEGGLVAERHVEKTVVGESRDRVEGSNLLTTARGTSADEQASELAVELTLGPETTGGIPEGAPLGRLGTKTGRDTEEEAVVLGQVGRSDDGVIRLGGSVHLGENLVREGLRDLEDVGVAASGLNTLLNSLGKGADVTVGRVVDDSNLRGHC